MFCRSLIFSIEVTSSDVLGVLEMVVLDVDKLEHKRKKKKKKE